MVLLIVFALPLLIAGNACGHESVVPQHVEIQEKIGQKLPLDAAIYDEDGAAVTLKQLFDRPVILSFVYYSCDRVCCLAAFGKKARKDNGPGK
ncbi:MAG: hypothetical protein HY880_01340 [Deltaproteobacteria bacterium]|nr:hypothetical protein [Deltaproteobacteria bacterium]